MVSKCANPKCEAPLHYLREGKVFLVTTPGDNAGVPAGKKPASHVEHFWLCGDCAKEMTLVLEGGKVITVPRPNTSAHKAAAA